MAKYGPTFGDEVIAAGLGGLAFSWSEEEIFGRENLTDEQNTTLDEVEAAHDPTKQPITVTGPEVAVDHEDRIFELEVRAGVRPPRPDPGPPA